MKFIVLENVFFGYKQDQEVLVDINLSLEMGQITAIVGSNGSGKTTLGKIVCGIIKPQKGRVLINNKDSKTMNLGEIGKLIGYLFQNPEKQIFAHSVYDELAFALRIKGIDEKTIDKKVSRKLDEFDLLHLKNEFPFNLSQGEKQRLAIASILINEVKYIVMDEPTTGLDVKRKDTLSCIISKLRKNGIGFILISHDDEFIQKHADNILVLKDGMIANYENTI